MMQVYQEDGLAIDLASARVCQDIVLMAIANGPLNRNECCIYYEIDIY